MKKIFIILCLTTFAAACGSKGNKVNSSSSTVSGSEGLVGSALVNFTGKYDILRKETPDCSNTIRIVSECSGLKILSNDFNPAEEFCNVNKGTFRSNPPNPDRNPPNPDGSGETKTVTLNGNVLISELRLSPRVAFTNTLIMNSNGILMKESNLKRGSSRCIYQKVQ